VDNSFGLRLAIATPQVMKTMAKTRVAIDNAGHVRVPRARATANRDTRRPPAFVEDKKVMPSDQVVERLKEEIRHLYPAYQTRRLELGLKLYQLREMTAHYGNGSFTKIAVDELGIPRSTVYELIDFADAELKRLEKESLSKNETNSDEDDAVFTFDWGNPQEVAHLMRLFYPKGIPKPKRKPKPYIKTTQLHLILDRSTRLKVAAAWKVLRQHREVHKSLCEKIAREVVDAAAKVAKSSHDGRG
jgi:hypothetical protein